MNVSSAICTHYGICGGCLYPHDSYFESHLFEKESSLLKLFEPLCNENTSVYPVIPCPVAVRFRNKMEFSFHENSTGERTLGLMNFGRPRNATKPDGCLLIDPIAITCLNTASAWWDSFPHLRSYFPPRNKGSLSSLTIRHSRSTNELMVILTTSGRSEYALDQKIVLQLVEDLKMTTPLSSFIWKEKFSEKGIPTYYKTTCLFGSDHINMVIASPDEMNTKQFCVKSDSFFQPNDFQITNIFRTILNLADFSGSETLLDLFCGSGTIGIMLASFVKEVIGVEINEDSINSAYTNLKINDVKSMTLLQSDVKKYVQALSLTDSKPDIAIVDPPRCGLQAKIIKYLLRIGPKKIIYVSCQPKTQFLDCIDLINAGYRIVAIQPIDQFPYTPHLENVILLQKNPN